MTQCDDTSGPGDPPVPENTTALRKALDVSGVGIFVLAPDFTVEWANGSIEEYFGVSRDRTVGEDKRDLLHSEIKGVVEDSESFADRLLATYENNTYAAEFTCHVLPGEGRQERWLLHQSHPIEEGRLAGGRIEQYTDITERETELERRNERLDEFTTVVGHDLRNPLQVAEVNIDIARNEFDSERLERVARSVARMRELVDDLLELAQSSESVAELEPVSLSALAEACWDTVATEDARLVVETDARFRADPGQLKRLLENLVHNAVDHGSTTPRSQTHEDADEHGPTNRSLRDGADGAASSTDGADGDTRIDVDRTDDGAPTDRGGTDGADEGTRTESTDGAGHAVTVTVGTLADGTGFYVADDGSGIPEGERESVLEPGYSTDGNGTGFGLSIVREICRAHGWTLEITESDAGGARFEVGGVDLDR